MTSKTVTKYNSNQSGKKLFFEKFMFFLSKRRLIIFIWYQFVNLKSCQAIFLSKTTSRITMTVGLFWCLACMRSIHIFFITEEKSSYACSCQAHPRCTVPCSACQHCTCSCQIHKCQYFLYVRINNDRPPSIIYQNQVFLWIDSNTIPRQYSMPIHI